MKKLFSMKNIGKGIGNFITNPNAVASAMGVPASEQTVDVKLPVLGSEPIVKAKAAPQQDLVQIHQHLSKKRRGRPKKLQTKAEVHADINLREYQKIKRKYYYQLRDLRRSPV